MQIRVGFCSPRKCAHRRRCQNRFSPSSLFKTVFCFYCKIVMLRRIVWLKCRNLAFTRIIHTYMVYFWQFRMKKQCTNACALDNVVKIWDDFVKIRSVYWKIRAFWKSAFSTTVMVCYFVSPKLRCPQIGATDYIFSLPCCSLGFQMIKYIFLLSPMMICRGQQSIIVLPPRSSK